MISTEGERKLAVKRQQSELSQGERTLETENDNPYIDEMGIVPNVTLDIQ